MIKKGFLSALFLIIVTLVSLNLSETIQSRVLLVTDNIKALFIGIIENVQESIGLHFEQSDKIESLSGRVAEFEKKEFHYLNIQKEHENLKKLFKSNIQITPDVMLARVVSYSNLGDFNKVWLDVGEQNISGIYGLVINKRAIGIAKVVESRTLGLLNGDEKCSYSVYVGKNRAPGIVRGGGTNTNLLVIDFIPSWIEIAPGDSVYTSGMDGVFIEGIDVGVVKKIEHTQGYQKAWVEPSASHLDARYFFLIKGAN